ncbi:integrase core domain-containing protein [Methylobacterium oxalidis]|uniref:integrase core domain-containing protein n=1 Tax=Methylobacterium oxalidis TaxID=944322 RepID=UPI003315D10F
MNVKRLLRQVDCEHLHGCSPSRSRSSWARSGRRPSHNALAETVIGLFKAEVIHRRGPWRSFEAVEYATLEWVDWFNHRRLLEPIGHIPPAEAEARYYAQAEVQALAA